MGSSDHLFDGRKGEKKGKRKKTEKNEMNNKVIKTKAQE
jgi:hypothetical protein